MEWASIISGIVKAFNFITQWMKEKELVNTGKALQQGEQDAKTLENISKGDAARNDAELLARVRKQFTREDLH